MAHHADTKTIQEVEKWQNADELFRLLSYDVRICLVPINDAVQVGAMKLTSWPFDAGTEDH